MSVDHNQPAVPAGHFIDGRMGRTGGRGRSGSGKDLRHAVEARLRHKSVLMDFPAA
ncbi:MAG: hypothetical protein Q8R01_08400 [Ramlibacter sp.]|nr:hypothetical protein [Ramlibacter sp.]